MISLGDRMKEYERATAPHLPRNMPVIVRIDGRAFHTFCRQLQKPFDPDFMKMMDEVTISICKEMMNCKLAYIQSDEISFLMYNHIFSDPWFGNDPQKLSSITASKASVTASFLAREVYAWGRDAVFDGRAFVLPEKDVTNYFVWRQGDWMRNSVQMAARSHFSQGELHGKNTEAMKTMLTGIGDPWNDYSDREKCGRCIIQKPETVKIMNSRFSGDVIRKTWIVDNNIPEFTTSPSYIESRFREEE